MLTRFFLWLVRFPRLKQAIWHRLYNLLPRVLPLREWQIMNYGYAELPETASPTLPLPSEYELQRYPLQMYHYLAELGPIEGKNVLEVGCGRGGGAHYLHRHFQPTSYTGVDFAEKAIDLCRKRYRAERLQFEVAHAEHLPFPDESFDVVINLESSRYYPNFSAFLAEVKRVLRPGGKLLYADYRLMPELIGLREALEQCGMRIVLDEDITPNVVTSLDRQADHYIPEIRKRVPFFLRGMLIQFSAVRGTVVYDSFRNGERCYYRMVLQKT